MGAGPACDQRPQLLAVPELMALGLPRPALPASVSPAPLTSSDDFSVAFQTYEVDLDPGLGAFLAALSSHIYTVKCEGSSHRSWERYFLRSYSM